MKMPITIVAMFITAILALSEGALRAGELWFFWYSDERGGKLPSAKEDSDLLLKLMHGRYPPGGASLWLEYKGKDR